MTQEQKQRVLRTQVCGHYQQLYFIIVRKLQPQELEVAFHVAES